MSTTGSDEKDVSRGLEVKSHQFDSEASGVEESLELTPQELRRLKRIVDWRILPYISLLYLLSALGGLLQRKSSRSHALAGFVDQVSWTV
jgi:hypothetical protein